MFYFVMIKLIKKVPIWYIYIYIHKRAKKIVRKRKKRKKKTCKIKKEKKRHNKKNREKPGQECWWVRNFMFDEYLMLRV